MWKIKVPASSANIGPGFDSLGMALQRYLILNVEKSDHWKFVHATETVPPVHQYKDHYIYRVATKVAKWYDCTLPPCHVTMHSEIPLARGLGSSASAIVASIELVNQLCGLDLSDDEKLACAVRIEGHPDNVAPALFGGLLVTVQMEAETSYKQLPEITSDVVIYIPDFELKTEDARNVLPKHFPMKDAATASSVSNLMVSALITGDYKLAGQMMESDLFHESYRAALIPNYAEIKSEARQLGAYGTVISGAGPTMISFVPDGKGAEIAAAMKQIYPDYEIESIGMDNQGLVVQQQTVKK